MKHLAILLGLAVFTILPRFSHADIYVPTGDTINTGYNGNYGLDNGGINNIGAYNCQRGGGYCDHNIGVSNCDDGGAYCDYNIGVDNCNSYWSGWDACDDNIGVDNCSHDWSGDWSYCSGWGVGMCSHGYVNECMQQGLYGDPFQPVLDAIVWPIEGDPSGSLSWWIENPGLASGDLTNWMWNWIYYNSIPSSTLSYVSGLPGDALETVNDLSNPVPCGNQDWVDCAIGHAGIATGVLDQYCLDAGSLQFTGECATIDHCAGVDALSACAGATQTANQVKEINDMLTGDAGTLLDLANNTAGQLTADAISIEQAYVNDGIEGGITKTRNYLTWISNTYIPNKLYPALGSIYSTTESFLQTNWTWLTGINQFPLPAQLPPYPGGLTQEVLCAAGLQPCANSSAFNQPFQQVPSAAAGVLQ